MEAGAPKDAWDKAQIVLQPVGGLVAAGALAALGFITSDLLNRRQAVETNTRLYSELMSKREESESNLRANMFNSIMTSFLNPKAEDINSEVLKLELLAYNFHESLNLKPLFLDLRRKVLRQMTSTGGVADRTENREYLTRLERVAREISRKQLVVLEGVGKKFDRTIDLTDDPEGTSLEPATLTLDGIENSFTIDILTVNPEAREIRMSLTIDTPDPELGRQTKMVTFDVSHFDFPMIDNTRLARGQRCAVVLNNFSDHSADITLALFPGAYSSLKEKPYYNEVLENVLSASENLRK